MSEFTVDIAPHCPAPFRLVLSLANTALPSAPSEKAGPPDQYFIAAGVAIKLASAVYGTWDEDHNIRASPTWGMRANVTKGKYRHSSVLGLQSLICFCAAANDTIG